jgi:hypothetical protein
LDSERPDTHDPNSVPPLKPLHPDAVLSQAKLEQMEKLSTDALIQSLKPGQIQCLTARPDGTILEGHHRIYVLRRRGVNVDALPREVREKD